jgi:hypothetical protein
MVIFLISLIPVCLSIWCVHILFQEDHLLEKPGDWIRGKVGEYWSKPLFDCSICMSSVYGLIGFFAIRFFFNVDLPYKQLIPFIFSLCGMNVLLSKLTSKERIIIDE